MLSAARSQRGGEGVTAGLPTSLSALSPQAGQSAPEADTGLNNWSMTPSISSPTLSITHSTNTACYTHTYTTPVRTQGPQFSRG